MPGIAYSLIAFIALLSGCGMNWVSATSDFQLRPEWRSYDRVVVDTRNGAVSVEAGAERTTVEGKITARGMTIEAANELLSQLEVTAEADPADPRALRVELRYPERLAGENFGASVSVRVPASTAVEVDTSNGKVVVRDALSALVDSSNGSVEMEKIAGSVRVSTSNGGLTLSDISGDVDVRTSNGAIRGRGLRGTTTLVSSNGGIELEEVNGSLSADTSNGAIRCSVTPPTGGFVRLDSSNAPVRLTVPASFGAKVRLNTSNARIQAEWGSASIQQLTIDDNDLACVMNAGDGEIIVDTSNGGIAVGCHK